MSGDSVRVADGVTLDRARGCLMRAGEPVHLRPQSYEVLELLVEHPGRLISKDALVAHVWKGRAVTDSSLGKCIEEVREALGPGARGAVRTVHGRGYLFEPPADEAPGSPGRLGSADRTDPGRPHRSGRRTALLIAASLSMLAVTLSSVGSSWRGGHVAASTPIGSIAVLPFINESASQELEYLSDGVTQSLIDSLAQLPGVKVIAHSSSFRFKGKDVDPRAAGRSLAVQAVMTGRVLRHGDDLVVAAELLDTRDGTHIWGERYRRKASDLLLLESDISREMAATLRLRLSAGDWQQLARRKTISAEAYDLLLRGRYSRGRNGTADQLKALEDFQQAIAVDSGYALAYAELSAAYSDLVTEGVLDANEFMPKAEAAAQRALALDATLAEAHLAALRVKLIAWDWSAAEWNVRRAVELRPQMASARQWNSFYLSLVGRNEEALAEAERARELDPLSAGPQRALGRRLLSAGRYDAALDVGLALLQAEPNDVGAINLLGDAYAAKGRYVEAAAARQAAINAGDDSPDTQVYLAAALAGVGEREHARTIVRRLERMGRPASPTGLALIHVALGEREQAFALLERAYAEHDHQLQFLLVEPTLDPLRADQRFDGLVHRVGLVR